MRWKEDQVEGAKAIPGSDLPRGHSGVEVIPTSTPNSRVGGKVKAFFLNPWRWLGAGVAVAIVCKLFQGSGYQIPSGALYFVAFTIPVSGWLLLRAEWMARAIERSEQR